MKDLQQPILITILIISVITIGILIYKQIRKEDYQPGELKDELKDEIQGIKNDLLNFKKIYNIAAKHDNWRIITLETQLEELRDKLAPGFTFPHTREQQKIWKNWQ